MVYTHTHIYMITPPMIHPSLLVNTPVQSSVPRCLVLESESIDICGVFCTSCTCLPETFYSFISKVNKPKPKRDSGSGF